jgi:segregation and condensation protein B
MAEPSLRVSLLAILFVASEPLPLDTLAHATAESVDVVSKTLELLKAELSSTGICLAVTDKNYRLVSAPQASAIVRSFLQAESSSDLSRAALETLAIVAYRGPITKANIESIRGVASDTMLRNLQARGLITVAGKSPEPGHPEIYVVSHSFLQHFGLTSPSDMPPLPEMPNEN